MENRKSLNIKEITIEVSQEEVEAFTSVLIDVLEYYSTLRRTEEFKLFNIIF